MKNAQSDRAVVTSDDTFVSTMEICYEILLYLSGRLSVLPKGGVLEFITSDPEAPQKIPSWMDVRGYELLEQNVLPDGRSRFLIRK